MSLVVPFGVSTIHLTPNAFTGNAESFFTITTSGLTARNSGNSLTPGNKLSSVLSNCASFGATMATSRPGTGIAAEAVGRVAVVARTAVADCPGASTPASMARETG